MSDLEFFCCAACVLKAFSGMYREIMAAAMAKSFLMGTGKQYERN